MNRLGVSLDVLRLDPADLGRPLPIWESAVDAGSVAVAVIDGTAAGWRDAMENAPNAFAELRDAPVLTLAVTRGGEPCALARACDLLAAGDRSLAELLQRIEAAPGPALVAAHLLRCGDARIATESLAYGVLLAGEGFKAWRAAKRLGRPEETWTSPRVEVDEATGTTVVRLTRPRKHNAYDARMREHLCDALDSVTAAGRGPVVLIGEGPSFCSGGDLDEFGRATDSLQAHLVRQGRSVARRLQRISERLVVGVHGNCIGAGVELAAYAQVVVAAQDARFALPELSLGLSLGAGGAVSIPRRIGRHRTLELLLRDTPIDAQTARAWGLADEVVAPGSLVSRCLARAADLR